MEEQTLDYEILASQLKHISKPYSVELKRRLKNESFLKQCVRAAEKEDFFALSELLQSRDYKKSQGDPELKEALALLSMLQEQAERSIDLYRREFIQELKRLAELSGLELQIDFPKFQSLPGISGRVDFQKRRTQINKELLKSVDPRRIIKLLLRLRKQLYGRSLDPQAFIEELFEVYSGLCATPDSGASVPIREFYLQLVLKRQSKRFFEDLEKHSFRGYPVDAFAVDLWRLAQSGVKETASGYSMSLRPGRNFALPLMDFQGERRQTSSISFMRSML